jgi:hypothetical protein
MAESHFIHVESPDVAVKTMQVNSLVPKLFFTIAFSTSPEAVEPKVAQSLLVMSRDKESLNGYDTKDDSSVSLFNSSYVHT